MQIILRDDDTNFFTQVDELENAFGELWERGIPVTLGVIPWIKPCKIRGVKFPSCEDDEYFAITQNTHLVKYLKRLVELDLVEIALHGIHHKDYSTGAEFVGRTFSRSEIRDAKAYLQATFDTNVTHFIPPHNSINAKNFECVCREGMRVLTSFSHLPTERPFGIGNLFHFGLSGMSVLIKQNKSYRYKGFKKIFPGFELGCHHILSDEDIEKLLGYLLDRNHDRTKCIGAASHYWEINEKNLSYSLRKMVENSINSGFRFILARDAKN